MFIGGIQGRERLVEGHFPAWGEHCQESLGSGVIEGGQLEATRRVGCGAKSVIVVAVRCRSTFKSTNGLPGPLVLFK